MNHLSIRTHFLSIFVLTFILGSCAHRELSMTPPAPTIDVSNISSKANGSYYTILQFEKGDNKLTPRGKEDIKEFISKTENEGALSNTIKILTWSDIKKEEALLADQRALAISEFFKKNLKTNHELILLNMTDQNRDLNFFLESDDPKTKKVFEKTRDIKEEGEDLASLKEHPEGKALILRDYE